MSDFSSLTNITALQIDSGRTGGQDDAVWSAIGSIPQLNSLRLGTKYTGHSRRHDDMLLGKLSLLIRHAWLIHARQQLDCRRQMDCHMQLASDCGHRSRPQLEWHQQFGSADSA